MSSISQPRSRDETPFLAPRVRSCSSTCERFVIVTDWLCAGAYICHILQENMKEAINHCMTVYGDKVRALAENPLLGPRFQNFIRRWEMNNASPPPEEEKKTESYVHRLVLQLFSAVDEPIVRSQMVRGAGDRAVSPRQKKRTTSMPTTTTRRYPSCLRLHPTRAAT